MDILRQDKDFDFKTFFSPVSPIEVFEKEEVSFYYHFAEIHILGSKSLERKNGNVQFGSEKGSSRRWQLPILCSVRSINE
jgi:hypothetical protein